MLQSMPSLVGGHTDARDRASLEDLGRQTQHAGPGIIVISHESGDPLDPHAQTGVADDLVRDFGPAHSVADPDLRKLVERLLDPDLGDDRQDQCRPHHQEIEGVEHHHLAYLPGGRIGPCLA